MYTLICDGGCKGEIGSRYGYGSFMILCGDTLIHTEKFEDLTGPWTNNAEEYNSLINGLEYLDRVLGRAVVDTKLHVMMDSQLILKQVQGDWKVKASHLLPLHIRAVSLLSRFQEVTLAWVPRGTIVEHLGH